MVYGAPPPMYAAPPPMAYGAPGYPPPMYGHGGYKHQKKARLSPHCNPTIASHPPPHPLHAARFAIACLLTFL